MLTVVTRVITALGVSRNTLQTPTLYLVHWNLPPVREKPRATSLGRCPPTSSRTIYRVVVCSGFLLTPRAVITLVVTLCFSLISDISLLRPHLSPIPGHAGHGRRQPLPRLSVLRRQLLSLLRGNNEIIEFVANKSMSLLHS